MFSFTKKQKGNRLTALAQSPAGTVCATIVKTGTDKPRLELCGFYPANPGQSATGHLQQLARQLKLSGNSVTTLLPIGNYQLMMVEAPEVPPAELKAAVRWRIRDLIDFHIDDAVLDVFDAPPSGARGVQESLYVVVSRTSTVKSLIEPFEAAGIELGIIDIPELAMRNIAARLEADKDGIALIFFGADHALVTLTRNSTLYLARSMDFGYRQLQESPELVDRLALELQRSMDYYDRHFQQAPISTVALCPLPVELSDLASRLGEQTGLPVQTIDIADIVEIGGDVETDQLGECVLAIGAALRTEATQL
ncbi:MSHA biogenesis protein MshI [Thiogranum longum]|uniref:MSHA biogenesis protein MshI n=1 Tax=Thiogranum longum TaxID=1537524 RepID=A0A4R1HCD6_9GAMM|nr:pilus assembly protein PilM [Thiogranum longum]TCK16879.1 MSHA biogenesis protein MshI [Thiogranum longum]